MAAKVFLVAGLGYGDEGKGSLVDYLVRRDRAPLVVRYNGGAQAAHNVVTDDGRHHTFSQFGSGTFAGSRTFLSRFTVVNPVSAYAEAGHLLKLGIGNPMSRVYVEQDALVATPFHLAANKLRELGRERRHGTCGMGIGETVRDSIEDPDGTVRVRDLLDRPKLLDKLERIRVSKRDEVRDFVNEQAESQRAWLTLDGGRPTSELAECYSDYANDVRIVGPEFLATYLRESSTVIFEGAQGVLLDQDYGWSPHNTWSDCTFGNASRLLREADHLGAQHRIGVLRGYLTRHGPGPFVTEDSELPVLEGEHNGMHPWQRAFRLGHFDALSLDYALNVLGPGPVDEIALTCLDHLEQRPIRYCTGYTTSLRRRVFDGIPVRHPSDYANDNDPFNQRQQHRQEEMGKILSRLHPVYETLPNVEALVDAVETRTKRPVRVCSYGPKASDKKTRLSRM